MKNKKTEWLKTILDDEGYCYEHSDCGETMCLGTAANEEAIRQILSALRDRMPKLKNGCRVDHPKSKPATTCSSGECLYNGAYNHALEDVFEALGLEVEEK